MTHLDGDPDHVSGDPGARAHDVAGEHEAGAHEAGGHGAAAGAGEHGADDLGPIDWAAYGAGVLGVLIGLGTALAFVVATNRLG